jgi:hypothetical protein
MPDAAAKAGGRLGDHERDGKGAVRFSRNVGLLSVMGRNAFGSNPIGTRALRRHSLSLPSRRPHGLASPAAALPLQRVARRHRPPGDPAGITSDRE